MGLEQALQSKNKRGRSTSDSETGTGTAQSQDDDKDSSESSDSASDSEEVTEKSKLINGSKPLTTKDLVKQTKEMLKANAVKNALKLKDTGKIIGGEKEPLTMPPLSNSLTDD